MQTKRNDTLKQLRAILGKSQTEFAGVIGSSKDAVVSWELGRNKLSLEFARVIRLATGCEIASLINGSGPPLFVNGDPYDVEYFNYWRQHNPSNAPEAQRLFAQSADALNLIFSAASKPGMGKCKDQLPAVWFSFAQWLDKTRQDFKLESRIDALLEERYAPAHPRTMSWADWRKLARSDKNLARLYQFKNDKAQPAKKLLTLTMMLRPGWGAHSDMRQKVG